MRGGAIKRTNKELAGTEKKQYFCSKYLYMSKKCITFAN